MISPCTRNVPGSSSICDLLYREFARFFKSSVLEMDDFKSIFIVFFLYSTGLPIPYRQETDATTITSLRPLKRLDVVLNLSFSISSLIDKSFSM